jgi:hypothetical protein
MKKQILDFLRWLQQLGESRPNYELVYCPDINQWGIRIVGTKRVAPFLDRSTAEDGLECCLEDPHYFHTHERFCAPWNGFNKECSREALGEYNPPPLNLDTLPRRTVWKKRLCAFELGFFAGCGALVVAAIAEKIILLILV